MVTWNIISYNNIYFLIKSVVNKLSKLYKYSNYINYVCINSYSGFFISILIQLLQIKQCIAILMDKLLRAEIFHRQ